MLESVDTYLFFLINRGWANPLFDFLMPLLSERGFLLALPLLAFPAFQAAGQQCTRRGTTVVLVLAVALTPVAAFYAAEFLNNLLKSAIARPRPCLALEGVRLLIVCPRSFSLPSGHAADSFAFALSFWVISRTVAPAPWRLFLAALAAIIAFSRIYIGVHYPSDILAGAMLGSGVGWSMGMLAIKLRDALAGSLWKNRQHDYEKS